MATVTEVQRVESIPIAEILSDSEFNCRGDLKLGDYAELMQSIREQGLLSPIHVQPYKDGKYKYRIIAGHRRFAACRGLGMENIRCLIVDNLSEVDALLFNLRENLDRKELNILQEAKAIDHLRREGLSLDEVARRINRTRSWVGIRDAVLTLPVKVQADAAAGLVTQMHILQLAQIHRREGETAVYEATKKIKEAKLRGETVKVSRASPKPVTTKKARGLPEIKAMLLYMMDVTNDIGSFGTVALAWAAGNVSDLELLREFGKWCKDNGLEYEVPRETDDSPHLVWVGK